MDHAMKAALATAYHHDQVKGDRAAAVAGLREWLSQEDGRRDNLQARLTEIRSPAYRDILRRDYISAVQAPLIEAALAD